MSELPGQFISPPRRKARTKNTLPGRPPLPSASPSPELESPASSPGPAASQNSTTNTESNINVNNKGKSSVFHPDPNAPLKTVIPDTTRVKDVPFFEETLRDLESVFPDGQWYPPEREPKTLSKTLLSTFHALTEKWILSGKQPEDLWMENGVMEKALEEVRVEKLSQNVARKARARVLEECEGGAAGEEQMEVDGEVKMAEGNVDDGAVQGVSSHKRALSTPSPAGPAKKAHLDTEPVTPVTPAKGIRTTVQSSTIDLDARKTPQQDTSTSRDTTLAHLRNDEMLTNEDLHVCCSLLPVPEGWFLFEPGFPKADSPPCRRQLPDRLFFMPNQKGHWTLLQVNRKIGSVNYWNSQTSILFDVEPMKKWFEESGICRWNSVVFVEEDMPQQSDNFNCGVFALVAFSHLVGETNIPERIDPAYWRRWFVTRLELGTKIPVWDLEMALEEHETLVEEQSALSAARSLHALRGEQDVSTSAVKDTLEDVAGKAVETLDKSAEEAAPGASTQREKPTRSRRRSAVCITEGAAHFKGLKAMHKELTGNVTLIKAEIGAKEEKIRQTKAAIAEKTTAAEGVEEKMRELQSMLDQAKQESMQKKNEIDNANVELKKVEEEKEVLECELEDVRDQMVEWKVGMKKMMEEMESESTEE